MTSEEIAARISELVSEVARLRSLIDAPEELLPLPSNRNCYFEIEFREASDGDDVDGYWLSLYGSAAGTCEAGVEYRDAVLYELFYSVTHIMALKRAGPRTTERDRRRSLFRYQLDLLEQLSPAWAAKAAEHHQYVLRDFPFADDA